MIKIVPILPHNYAIDFVAIGQKKYEWQNSDLKKTILKKIRSIKGIEWVNCWGRSKTDQAKNFTEIEIRVAIKFKTTKEKKQEEILEEIKNWLELQFITINANK